jgi:hypothetical protein
MPNVPSLSDVIPAAYRKVVYSTYVVIAFVLGGIQVGYASSAAGQPDWLTIAFNVLGYAGLGLGALAAGNTPNADAPVQVEVVDPPL